MIELPHQGDKVTPYQIVNRGQLIILVWATYCVFASSSRNSLVAKRGNMVEWEDLNKKEKKRVKYIV